MGKKKIEVCEICGKQECSGKIYWAYDEPNNKVHIICEDKTVFRIRPKIYYEAVSMYEEAYPEAKNNDVGITSKKYLISVCKKHGLLFIPVERFYFVECGNFAIAIEKPLTNSARKILSALEYLCIPFSQLGNGIIYNVGEKNLSDIKDV